MLKRVLRIIFSVENILLLIICREFISDMLKFGR